MRILLVEDHEDSARATRRLLELGGHHVTRASTIAEALGLCAGSRFDLLLADIVFAEGDGWELMRECRRLHGMRGVAMSAGVDAEGLRTSRDAGFLLHFDKPIEADELLAAIATIALTLPSSPEAPPAGSGR